MFRTPISRATADGAFYRQFDVAAALPGIPTDFFASAAPDSAIHERWQGWALVTKGIGARPCAGKT